MKIKETIITDTMLSNAVNCLIDNGIEKDDAEIVLQAIGYILLNEELFPDNIGG